MYGEPTSGPTLTWPDREDASDKSAKGRKKEGVPPVLVGLDWVGTWFLSILDPVAKLSLRVRPGRGGGATGDGANESGHGSCKREMQLELGEKRARGGDGRKLGNWVRSGGGGGWFVGVGTGRGWG